MNILIVDGNEKEASSRYTDMGMDTQYEVYKKVLNSLSLENLNIQIIHPAISNNFLPKGISLDDFDGVAWTGSLLNIYDLTQPIINQIELAKELPEPEVSRMEYDLKDQMIRDSILNTEEKVDKLEEKASNNSSKFIV